MKYILAKAFVREFPLALIQMWGRRYAKKFLGESMPKIPLYVFKFNNGLVTAYRNILGHARAVNTMIKKKISKDRFFIDHLTSEKAKALNDLSLLKVKKEISEKEFAFFLDKLFNVWPLHYIAQFIPLDEVMFNEQDRKRAIRLRKTVDKIIVDCWRSITPMLKRLYPKLGNLVAYISWDEIKNFNLPNIAELKAREDNGIILYTGEIVSQDELNELKRKHNFLLEDDQNIIGVKEFTGQIACRGKVSGCIRKVLKEKDIKFFKPGRILVSYMTMPAFMPAMKKAVAFVTDEGGITSHAAIIAREMKKPCIIGTQIATRVLHDGDLAEVDADKGVVRIIKKAK